MTPKFQFPEHDYSYVLYTSLKNEGPYVLDWICYHLKIGFTHIVIATNDCDDGTDNLLRQLEFYGIVTHQNNPSPHPQGILKHAFLKLQDLEPIIQAKWLMHLDIDEYLRIDVGHGEIIDLVAACGTDTQAVSLVCQVFGSNGKTQLVDEPVISQFTKSSHQLQAAPPELRSLKTLYRNGNFDNLGTYRPSGFNGNIDIDSFSWFDADGTPARKLVNSSFHEASQNGFAFGTAVGRVNRYSVQSIEAFAYKCQRGFHSEEHPLPDKTLTPHEYWLRNNWNLIEDRKILVHLEKSEAIKNQIFENQKIKKLHKKSFRLHCQTINKFRRNNQEFFDEFEHLEPLEFGQDYPLILDEEHPSDLQKWFVNTNTLRQKLMVTEFLKYYIDGVDYGPTATELP